MRTEYTVVEESSVWLLGQTVTQRFSEGWQLYGNPWTWMWKEPYEGDIGGENHHCQAMIRENP